MTTKHPQANNKEDKSPFRLRAGLGILLFCILPLMQQAMLMKEEALNSGKNPATASGNNNAWNDIKELFVSNISKDNNTTTTTTLDNNNKGTWNAMASRLCPNMVPQSQLGPQLFALARKELGNISSSSWCPPHHNVDKDVLMSKVFYRWYWNDATYQGAAGSNFSMSYIWKCANDQLTEYFKKSVHFDTITKFVPTQREPGILSLKDQKQQSRPPPKCIVAAIRDPIRHFLSGYNEVEYRIHRYPHYRATIATAWNFGKLQTTVPHDRFRQFLTDFLSCPFERRYPGIYPEREMYTATLELSHVYSMTGVLHHLHERTAVQDISNHFHYFSSFGNLSKGWGPFVANACPSGTFSDDQITALHKIPVGSNQHQSSARDSYKIIQQTWQNDMPLARALCAIHLLDYACWRDLPNGVPTVCQELYDSYEERGVFK